MYLEFGRSAAEWQIACVERGYTFTTHPVEEFQCSSSLGVKNNFADTTDDVGQDIINQSTTQVRAQPARPIEHPRTMVSAFEIGKRLVKGDPDSKLSQTKTAQMEFL